ncbi:MAG: hypothetical protein ABSD72_09125 [Terracidiphilus sp.]|jgi:hypothetical protein
MPKLDNQTIMLALAAAIGLAVLLQTIILLAMFVTMRKVIGAIREEAESLRAAVMPVIYDSRDVLASSRDVLANSLVFFGNSQKLLADAQAFFTRVSPKIESTIGDAADITRVLQTQATEMQASTLEIMEQVRKQSERIDGMMTHFLDTVDRAGGYVADVVSTPVRQISSVLRAAKAIVESLRGAGVTR